MKPSRLVLVLACLVLALVIVAAVPSGGQPASAAPAPRPPRPIECTSMSMTIPSAPIVISGCNRRGITGGSGSPDSCPIGFCIGWSTGKETDVTLTSSAPSTSRCAFPLGEVDFVGRAVAASGAGTKRLIGTAVSFDACFAEQINVLLVELVPGTKFTMG